ncbi:MAG: CBS domain-containing protein, partial [Planctomycetes bacterium]|nr:CBS domain-containing protein [Planctomycetota bacterium]
MLTAKSIMRSDVVSIKCDTSVHKAAGILIEKKFTGLPVVNDDMTLAGIVSEKDILRFVSDLHLLDLICDLQHSDAIVADVMTSKVVSFE